MDIRYATAQVWTWLEAKDIKPGMYLAHDDAPGGAGLITEVRETVEEQVQFTFRTGYHEDSERTTGLMDLDDQRMVVLGLSPVRMPEGIKARDLRVSIVGEK